MDSVTEGSSMFELLKCGLVVLGCLFLHKPFTVRKTHRTKLLWNTFVAVDTMVFSHMCGLPQNCKHSVHSREEQLLWVQKFGGWEQWLTSWKIKFYFPYYREKNRTEGLGEKLFHCFGSELSRWSLVFQYVLPCGLKQLLLKTASSALWLKKQNSVYQCNLKSCPTLIDSQKTGSWKLSSSVFHK